LRGAGNPDLRQFSNGITLAPYSIGVFRMAILTVPVTTNFTRQNLLDIN
jgi:hypothetical protein